MAWKIPLFKIYWDKNDVRAVARVIESGEYWAMGPDVDAFEKKVASFVGSKYALAFNSGTSALHAVMAAYGFSKGDEIIVPSFSFIATANSPLFVGATPVFAEIEAETFGLDPKDVERKITKNTRAIMPMHYGGSACNITALRAIAKRHKIALIEDAAESLGTKIGKKQLGTFGEAAMFSFCGPKVITMGEGGVIVTNKRDLYEKMKLVRSHGRLETANYFSTAGYLDYIQLGYNWRMSSMTAALGASQMDKITKVIALRRKNAAYLIKKLEGVTEIVLPLARKDVFASYQMFTIIVRGGKKMRDSLKDHLNGKGIMAKVYFDPIHLTTFYKKQFGYKKGDLPVTESIAEQVLTLPMYPSLSKQELDYMTGEIKRFFANHAA